MPDFNDLPPTLWYLCHNCGRADVVCLWTVPPNCMTDDGRVLLMFTTRAGAKDYADTMPGEIIVACEVATADLPRLVALAGGAAGMAMDFEADDGRSTPWDEFEEMVGGSVSVPVVVE
jgi:hypothetical protein